MKKRAWDITQAVNAEEKRFVRLLLFSSIYAIISIATERCCRKRGKLMKDTIKSRFYRIDITVQFPRGNRTSVLPYVEYAESRAILDALINHIRKDLIREDYTVISCKVDKADNDDIREYLAEDPFTSQRILIEMLDIAYNKREGQ
jgi:hypothetical protein